MIKLLLIATVVHAGWWSTFCERHLIAEDPYQYDQAPMEWLIQERDFYQVKEAWNKLTARQAAHLRIIRWEIARREYERLHPR